MIWCSWCCSGTESRAYELNITKQFTTEETKKLNLKCDCCGETDMDEIYLEIDDETPFSDKEDK